MPTPSRLIVFGLPRGTTKREFGPLIEPFGESTLSIVEVPGSHDESMAVVQLGHRSLAAARLSRRLDGRQLGGHALKTWLTVLPWA